MQGPSPGPAATSPLPPGRGGPAAAAAAISGALIAAGALGGAPAAAAQEFRIENVASLSPAARPFPLVEPFLVIDPTDPDVLIASAMSVTSERSVVYRSGDGGSTWEAATVPAEGIFPGGDPMLTFDADGTAYFATITPELAVWRSEDGGRSWRGPAAVPQGGVWDREWVAAGTDPVTGEHLVVAAGKTIRTDNGERRDVIVTSRSADGGRTFAPPETMPVDSGYLHAVTDLEILPDGTVLLPFKVNYRRISGTAALLQGRYWMLHSADSGRTWTGPRFVGESRTYANAEWDRAMKGLGVGSVAADSTGGPHDGNLYMAWVTTIDGWLQVVASRSTDGGVTWSEPARVNDDGFDSNHSSPMVAVGEDGLVAVTWNDRRADPDDLCFRHYIAFSLDGGESFGAGHRVSEMPTCPGEGSRWLNGGETQGLAALPGGGFRVAWSVGERDSLAVWTAVVRPVVE